MAKKVVNKKTKTERTIAPVNQQEAEMMKNVVEASNAYAQLLKQLADYELAIKQLTSHRTDIQKGIIPLPITIDIARGISYQEDDKKKILAIIDTQLKSMKESLFAIKGQVEYRKDYYTQAAIQLTQHLGLKYKKDINEVLAPERSNKKKTDVIFEADFDELMKDEKLQKELEEATKE